MPRQLLPSLATLALLVAVAGCGGGGATRSTGVPAAARPSASDRPGPPPPVGAGSPTPDTHRVFPVAGKADYGRSHHDYPATDIFAPCGARVRSPVDGVILEVSRTDRFDIARPLGADKGGLSVSIRGDDGVRYYGAHLATIAPAISTGVRVRPGTELGLVGQTGNASHVCHLHFGLSPVCAGTGDWWVRRGVVFPWRYLDSWRAGGNLSPVDEVAAWQRDHGCPSAPRSGER